MMSMLVMATMMVLMETAMMVVLMTTMMMITMVTSVAMITSAATMTFSLRIYSFCIMILSIYSFCIRILRIYSFCVWSVFSFLISSIIFVIHIFISTFITFLFFASSGSCFIRTNAFCIVSICIISISIILTY